MEKRRVVITGMGAVTPLGNCVDVTWAGVMAGKSGVGAITQHETCPAENSVKSGLAPITHFE